MKRAIATLVLAVMAVVGIRAMMDATQNRPDAINPDSSSTVEFTVATRGFRHSDADAASMLASVCAATTLESLATPAVAGSGAGATWRVRITPALGENGRKRFVGCMEDATLDRVSGHVVSIRTAA
jgi:hypothetical protein